MRVKPSITKVPEMAGWFSTKLNNFCFLTMSFPDSKFNFVFQNQKLGMQSAKWESTVEHARKCQISEDDVNIFNFEGNGLSDSVSPNLDVQPGNIEDANLNHMVNYTFACCHFTQIPGTVHSSYGQFVYFGVGQSYTLGF